MATDMRVATHEVRCGGEDGLLAEGELWHTYET